MQIRAVVVDFDGTIAGDQQPLTNRRLIRILAKIADSGIPVILLTGRDIDYAIGPTGLRTKANRRRFAYVLGEGGTVAWNSRTDRVEELTEHRSHELMAEMRRLPIPSDEIWADHCAVMSLTKNAPLIEQAIASVNRTRHRNHQPPLRLTAVTNGGSVSFLPPGIDKRFALRTLVRDRLGIPLDCVLGSGDGENDREWLRDCGAAVIPANAIDDLKRLPNALVSGRRDAEALAEVLEQSWSNGMTIEPPGRAERSVA